MGQVQTSNFQLQFIVKGQPGNFHFLKNNFYPEIDWLTFLLGSEKWNFLPELALRSLLMFLVILFSLRILGKSSVTQLSVFDMGVIIGLGSAAGDPMFYKDVGMLSGFMAFAVVISLYRFMTFLINSSDKVEDIKNNEEGRLCQVCENDEWVLAIKSQRTV